MEYRIPSGLTEEQLKKLVTDADEAFERTAENKVRSFAGLSDLKILGLTGPSCSGKTTAANKLISLLQSKGRRVIVVSLDDFFKDVEAVRTGNFDPSVKIDFDSEEAMDLSFLEQKVESLLACKPTRMPKFDFHNGHREDEVDLLTPTRDDVFLFEGIQVLYPGVDAILSKADYRSIYICPESSIITGGECFTPNELRLMRRIVRDYLHRSADAEFTFFLWQGVRENEENAIFPFKDRCREQIDSTLPYEVGMLKPYLVPLLSHYREDALFYREAKSLLAKLQNVPTIPVEYLTEHSLFTEFI